MAALQGYVEFGAAGSVPLSSGTAKSAVVVTAPANQRVKITGYGFFFDGTSNSATPVQIRIARASAAGTGTSFTPKPNEEECTETFQSTWKVNNTVEPTYTNYIKTLTVHPQLGYEYLAPLGQEIIVKGGGILGFECTAPAGVNVRGVISFEE